MNGGNGKSNLDSNDDCNNTCPPSVGQRQRPAQPKLQRQSRISAIKQNAISVTITPTESSDSTGTAHGIPPIVVVDNENIRHDNSSLSSQPQPSGARERSSSSKPPAHSDDDDDDAIQYRENIFAQSLAVSGKVSFSQSQQSKLAPTAKGPARATTTDQKPTLRANHESPNIFFPKSEPIGGGDIMIEEQRSKDIPAMATIQTYTRSAGVSSNNNTIRGLQLHKPHHIQLQEVQQVAEMSLNQSSSRAISTLSAPVGHESVCRSASSSPRIERRQPAAMDPNPTFGLGVPRGALSRKLSLQPVHYLAQSTLLGNSAVQQQQQQLQQQLQHQQPIQSAPLKIYNPHMASNSNQTGSAMNLNNLAVDSQHLAPRKSIIGGKLTRSSFQAQRLSDVGVAFGQQITARMGLKLPASQERIVEQTRWLYLRYVFVKLRQNALPLRDLNLSKSSRARRAAALGEPPPIELGTSTSRSHCSAPNTAPAIGTDQEPPDGNQLGAGFSQRKRTAMSQNISPQDLNLLAARLQTSSASPLSNVDPINKCSEDSSEIANTATGISTNSTAKRYIMDPTINNQIFSVIMRIIRELRDSKPEFYGDTIYELIGIEKFSSLQSLLDVQMTICQEMTRSEISWCRISALFSLFGAMSLDCVRLGAPEHVGPILDGFIEFVERDLALWISQQGGWESFLYKYRASYWYWDLSGPKLVAILLAIMVWALVFVFK